MILAVDSSAVSASAAVLRDGVMIADFTINAGLTHSRTLLAMIESVLKTADVDIAGIDAFAVTNGPGSFTGIRIGVALIKGMALALDKPCIPVSTLEGIAASCIDFDGLVCPVMDARRSQVYNALFRCCDRKMERLCPDRAIGIDELKDELKTYSENIYVVGDGADICADHFSDLKNVKFTSQLLKFQNAVNVAEIAYMRYNNHEYIDGRRLVPSYLRLSQAERVRAEKLGKADC